MNVDLKNFLIECKKRIENDEVLSICMGSLACDLDSFCSSLVFAYSKNIIPIINMTKIVFESKDEILFVCEQINIEPNDLIYVNNEYFEFEDDRLLKKIRINESKILLYLVDENEPSKLFQNSKVKQIVDHYKLFKIYDKDTEIKIELEVKSCSSLISQIVQVPKHIRKILFYAIIFNTDNLKDSTKIDKEQFSIICDQNNFDECYRLEILDRIKKLRKLNEETQSDYILLRKDYKQYGNFGLSSVRYRLSKWIERNGSSHFVNGVKKFMDLQEIKYLFINFNCKIDGVRKRYLMVFPQDFPQIDQLFIHIPKEKLIQNQGIIYYGISPDFSRKKIMPSIRNFFSLINV